MIIGFRDTKIGFMDLMLVVLFFVFLFSFSFKSPQQEWNQDLGRHIKMGEIILKTKSVPRINLFSYTNLNFPFVDHHWLSEVVFYLVYTHFGNFGLVFLKTSLILISFALLILTIKKRSNIALLIFFWVLSALIFRERVDIRPEVFGFFFFSVFIYALDEARTDPSSKVLLCLPIISFLWVNFHMSFVFAPFLAGIYIIDRIFFRKFKPSENLWAVLVFIAPILNPNFLHGALYPFLVFKNYNYKIYEAQSIFYLSNLVKNPNILFFEISFLLSLIVLFIKRERNLFLILGFFGFSFLAAWQIRHFPFYALFAVYFFNQQIPPLSDNFFLRSLSFVMLFFLIFSYVSNDYYQTHNASYNFYFLNRAPIQQASRGVDFMLGNVGSEHVFNNFDIGSYLDFRFYPQRKVFVDSRPEAYPNDFWDLYRNAQLNEKVWEGLVKKYNIKAVFFSHTDSTPWAGSLLSRLANSKDWRIVYLDDFSVVFFRRDFREAVKAIDRHKALEIARGYKDHREVLRLSRFFGRVGWNNEAKDAAHYARTLYPYFCGGASPSFLCYL